MAWREAVQRVWWNQARGWEWLALTLLLFPFSLAYRLARAVTSLPWWLNWRRPALLRAPVGDLAKMAASAGLHEE